MSTKHNKQIFFFNLSFCLISEIIYPRYCSSQCEGEFNIILLGVNNFVIKLEKARKICFIIWDQHQRRSGKIKANKTQQISELH